METSLVNGEPFACEGSSPTQQRVPQQPTIADEHALAWVRLLAPRTEEEAAMATRIAMASRHIWAFRLHLTPQERIAWFRGWGTFR
jgi:hypothetical protein